MSIVDVKREYNPAVKVMSYYIETGVNHGLDDTIGESNSKILSDFYSAVEWLLSRKYDKYTVEYSNTINPAQQNIFTALRSYKVIRNGHLKSVKIYQRAFGGCVVTECDTKNEISL